MLEFFPMIGLLAAGTSLVMVAMLAAADDLRARGGAIAIAVFFIAVYLQFFSGSPNVRAAGLVLQTLLAVSLIVRWRLNA
jgi:hypothetical protein